MKFFYSLLLVAAFAVSALAEAEVAAEKKQNWFQGVWDKVQEINPFDDMIDKWISEFQNSSEGKKVQEGNGNAILETIIWAFKNKDEILKSIQEGVQGVLDNIKKANPVCELIDNLKETNFLPTDKKVSSNQLKTIMEKLDELKETNPLIKLFYGPISNAIEKFSESNPLCGMLTTMAETHPIFAVVKNLAKVNPIFGTLEDIYNESKQCLCAVVNPAEFVMEVVG